MESVLAFYHEDSENSTHVFRLAHRATSQAVLHFFSKLKHFRKKIKPQNKINPKSYLLECSDVASISS